ncbi:MAG: glycosyltransferase family 4 protein [Armatimonadota bacterium]|nr:glycosyltransferase family 4 protein [bacterium]
MAPDTLGKSKSLRIVHVVPNFIPEGHGGLERHVSSISREMSARHDVYVIAFTNNLELIEHNTTRQGDVKVIWLQKRQNIGDMMPPECPELDARLREAITSIAPDVVHIHYLAGLSTGIVGVAKDVARAVLITLHDYASLCPGDTIDCAGKLCFSPGTRCLSCLHPSQFSRKRLMGYWRITNPAMILFSRVFGNWPMAKVIADLSTRKTVHFKALEQANVIIAPSHAIADVFIGAGLAAERVKVITHGTDKVLGVPHDRPLHNPLRFGFIGSNRLKGFELLHRAYGKIADNRTELHVFGNQYYPASSRTNSWIKKVGSVDHGRFDPDDINQVYERFDMLVAPSIWIEPFGLVALEALARGVPVIATNRGGFTECVKDGVNGLLFELGDVEELSRALRRCVEEPGLVERLKCGIGTVKSTAEQALELEELYTLCLAIDGDKTCRE